MIYNLSSRLKETRMISGYSQKRVAQLTGVSEDAISSYERGLRVPPLDILIKLAQLYKISTDYLLGLNKSKAIDMSRLDENDFIAVRNMVEILSDKNDRLIKYKERRAYETS